MTAARLAAAVAAVGVLACGDAPVEVQEAEASSLPASGGTPEDGAPVVRRIESGDGAVVEVLDEGRGGGAALGDRVTLHLHGTVAGEETIVTSTRTDGIPRSFVLGRDRLIPGLERHLLGMRAGSRSVLHLPASEAYGDTAVGAVPAGSDLVFEVHLLSVEPTR